MHKPDRPTRPRALQACEVCRTRKNRCSEDRPCTYCVDHDLECVYSRTNREWPKFVQQASANRTHRDKRQKFTQQASNPADGVTPTKETCPSPSSGKTGKNAMLTTAEILQHNSQCDISFIDESTQAIGQSTLSPQNSASEVIDTNSHTRNLEFYGGSSSVAFLRHVETMSNNQVSGQADGSSQESLASMLHNTEFRPSSIQDTPTSEKNSQIDSSRFYFRTGRRFLDAYFSNIHHIQPLFDEEPFLTRCEDLWFNRPEKQPLSFVALYYATLSLGSLVMIWDDRDMYGTDRFSWSRKLFNDALNIVTQLGSATNMEMVQCFYMLGKVCQHELNPHVAYLYAGQAARTALAIGINRQPVEGKELDPRASRSASMTWWAVYCLDIQTSFALGRPDSLGPDEYHTQNMPGTPASNHQDFSSTSRILQITPFMVEVSKIMRSVGLKLYTTPCSIEERARRAKELDSDLEFWLRGLPAHFQITDQSSSEPSLKPRLSAGFALKQSVVLKLRYHNLRMVIHGVFMTVLEPTDSSTEKNIRDYRQRCIESACHAIDLMYNTFKTDNYFQTWWYNATYTLFAVSILLTAVFHRFSHTMEALDSVFSHIDRAIAVLQAMDECIVARKASSIIKRALCRAKKVPHQGFEVQGASNLQLSSMATPIWNASSMGRSNNTTIVPASSTAFTEQNVTNVVDEEFDWLDAFPFDDGQQALFWTEWAHELDVLGT